MTFKSIRKNFFSQTDDNVYSLVYEEEFSNNESTIETKSEDDIKSTDDETSIKSTYDTVSSFFNFDNLL